MSEPVTKEYLDEKLDKFADTVQRGFVDAREHIDARFDEVNERFGAVDKRFGAVDATLSRMSIGVADLKVGRQEDQELLRRLEESANRVYNRIDEFLVIMKR